VFSQAINWFPDPSEAPGLLTKILIQIQKYETLEEIMKITKTKIDPVEDYKSKIRKFEIRPKSTIQVEFRGLLTRV
jgi:hypothetical protein